MANLAGATPRSLPSNARPHAQRDDGARHLQSRASVAPWALPLLSPSLGCAQEYADGGDLLQLLMNHGTRLSERRSAQLVLVPLLRAVSERRDPLPASLRISGSPPLVTSRPGGSAPG